MKEIVEKVGDKYIVDEADMFIGCGYAPDLSVTEKRDTRGEFTSSSVNHLSLLAGSRSSYSITVVGDITCVVFN